MPLAVISFEAGVPQENVEIFAKDVVGGIREFLFRNLKSRTGRLEDSIYSVVYGKAIIIDSNVPYAKIRDRGSFQSKVLWDLINKVVPLKLHGRTVFRRVTVESILRGSWRQKPVPAMDYIRGGIEIARSKTEVPGPLRPTVVKP